MSDLQVHFETAAQWWAEQFKIDDKRAAFKAALLELLPGLVCRYHASPDSPLFNLRVDYDPIGAMLEAVRAAGVECEGCMFSAEGILPGKTTMWIYTSGVEVCHGRLSDSQWLSTNPPSNCVECNGEGGKEFPKAKKPDDRWVPCGGCNGARRYFHGHPKWQAPE